MKRVVASFDKCCMLVVFFCLFKTSTISLWAANIDLFADSTIKNDGKFFLTMDIVILAYMLKLFSKFKKVTLIIPISFIFLLLQLFGFVVAGTNFSMVIVIRYCVWFLVMMFFYYYIKENRNDLKFVLSLWLGLLIVLIYTYLSNLNILRNDLDITQGLNEVYWVLLCMPVIFMLKNNFIKFIALSMIGISVILSYKATGISAFGLSIVVYFLIYSKVKYKKGYFGKVIMALVFVLILMNLSIINGFIYQKTNFDWGNKLDFAYTKGGSGRTDIWKSTIQMQGQSNFFDWIFGHGHNRVISYVGSSAHNDFLEVLFDYGLFTFGVYIYLYVCLLQYLKQMLSIKFIYTPAFSSSIICFFVLSMFSHLILNPGYMMLLSSFWGVSIAEYENERSSCLNEKK